MNLGEKGCFVPKEEVNGDICTLALKEKGWDFEVTFQGGNNGQTSGQGFKELTRDLNVPGRQINDLGGGGDNEGSPMMSKTVTVNRAHIYWGLVPGSLLAARVTSIGSLCFQLSCTDVRIGP